MTERATISAFDATNIVDLDYMLRRRYPGFYWQIGTHQQFKYECRIWRYLKPFSGKAEVIIGFGDSILAAVDDLLVKAPERSEATS